MNKQEIKYWIVPTIAICSLVTGFLVADWLLFAIGVLVTVSLPFLPVEN